MAHGSAQGTNWFQLDKVTKESGEKVVFFKQQIERMDAVHAVDRRLKSQIIVKKNLLREAIKYYSGAPAHFPRGRDGATPPRNESDFESVVMGAINDIPLMFERAGISE
jgi:hypothetical protein